MERTSLKSLASAGGLFTTSATWWQWMFLPQSHSVLHRQGWCHWVFLDPLYQLKPKSLSRIRLSVTPMDYTVHGILQVRIPEWVFFPSPGDLPNPWIKPGSPALQADSLPTELAGTPFSVEGAPSSLSLLMCVCACLNHKWALTFAKCLTFLAFIEMILRFSVSDRSHCELHPSILKCYSNLHSWNYPCLVICAVLS